LRRGGDWGGMGRLMTTDATGRALGVIGPVTNEYLCLQRGRTLMALHPRSGALLWMRQGIDANSQLFGDDEVVMVAAADGDEVLVLRALDGQELGRRRIAGVQERLATRGRYVLAWRMENGEARVSLDDPWMEREVWSRSFDPRAKVALLGLEAVGVVADDEFTLLDVLEGRQLVRQPIEPLSGLHEIYVLGARDRYLLIANRPFQANERVAGLQPIPEGDKQIINGHVYGFDRGTGQRVWMTPVEHQGLMFAQPVGLPALVFACHVYRRPPGNAGFETLTAILCLDKRDGAIVFQEEIGQHVQSLEIAARPDANAIDLKLPRNTIALTFTDQAPPAPLPQREDVQAAADVGEEAQDAGDEADGVFGEEDAQLPRRIDEDAEEEDDE